MKATSVDQEVVDEQTPGLPIGILGAPQTLPRPKQFIETGWTACTDDGVGIAVDVSNDERVDRTTSAAIVVESAGGYWLIATSGSSEGKQQRAYRYPIAEGEGDNLLVDYGLGQKVEAISVPPEWLGLFPEGGEIGPAGFDLPHLGRKADPSPVPGARVGDYVVDGSRAAMVIDGGWQPLDPFALAVLENSSFKNGPNLLTEGELPASYAETTYTGAHWPDTKLGPLNSAPCAQLDVAAGQVPRVWLAGSPIGDAESPALGAKGAIPDDQRNVTLDRGHGAFVQVGTWDEAQSDSMMVIDPLGRAYTLSGGPVTARQAGLRPGRGAARAGRVDRALRRGGGSVDECRAVPTGQPAGGAAVVEGLPGAAVVRVSLAYAAVLAVSLVISPAASASADEGVEADCQAIPAQDATHYATSEPSLPLQEMGVDDALARLKKQHVQAGAGVTVAVIDSGVASNVPITIAGTPVETGNKSAEPVDYHGTAVAGLIAGHPRPDGGGPVGIAPGAQIYDVQVYDEADASSAPDSTQSPMTVENLRRGLDAVIAAAPTLGIRIVNMSLAIPDDAGAPHQGRPALGPGGGRGRAHRQPLHRAARRHAEHLRGAPVR